MNKVLRHMKYKGYTGTVEYSEEDDAYIGQLRDIRDLVIYESEDASGLKAAFEEAVDDYLDFCKDEGVETNALTARFSVSSDPDLHCRARQFAKINGMSLSALARSALAAYLEREERTAAPSKERHRISR